MRGPPRATVVPMLVLIGALAPGSPAQSPTATIGIPVVLREVVLPGTELQAKPADFKTPVLVRVLEVRQHGTALRYDFEYQALEPGRYDLTTFLERKDGSPSDDLPAVPIEVRSVLPPGQVPPNPLPPAPEMRLGGYFLWMALGAIVWIGGLLAIMLVGRKPTSTSEAIVLKPRTLAERLRPIVERAQRGELPPAERAKLELGLVALWRERLQLTDLPAADLLARLRQHPEAGPLIRGLEDWLHRPPGTGVGSHVAAVTVDVPSLLAPYGDLPPEALEDPRVVRPARSP